MAIRSFADKTTRRLFEGGAPKGVPQDAKVRALDKLAQLNAAERIEDMAVPPGNQLKALGGGRKGQHAVKSISSFGFASPGRMEALTTWKSWTITRRNDVGR